MRWHNAGMAKKKPQQTPESADMPTVAADTADTRSGSRHKPRKMLSLSPRQYELLTQLARRNRRPVAWEGRIAVNRALVEAGLMTEEEADRMEYDD